MRTKTNYLRFVYVFIFLCILSAGLIFSSCNHSIISQITAIDTSIYSLPEETQIEIYPAKIPGKKFYDYYQHSDYLYFTFFKHSNKYKIKGYAMSSSLISPMKISKSSASQTVPSSVDSSFTMRGEKISIAELSGFFHDLYSIDSIDFIHNPENYTIHISPDPYIQKDSLGRYFNIVISASPKDTSSSFKSSVKVSPHPCPVCHSE